jgi:hypothetical protein
MKKLLFILALLPLFACAGLAQDLLTGGRSPAASEPNTLAQLIEDRKAQRAGFQPVELFRPRAGRAAAAYEAYVADAIVLELDEQQLKALIQQAPRDMSFRIPLATGRHITLELTRVEAVSPAFTARTSSGTEAWTAPTGYFYQGIVAGDASSMAALSLFAGHLRVLIGDEAGNYVLGRSGQRAGDYLLYNDAKLKMQPDFSCGNASLPARAEQSALDAQLHSKEGDCVGIYIECDFSMYQSAGNSGAAVVDYVLALFNEVALLYRNESIDIEVSEIFIWSAPDPYLAVSNTSDALNLFAQTLQDNYQGRLAHLLSSRGLGGGIAWINVLCSTYSTFEADWDDDGEDETYHHGPYAVSGSLTVGAVTPVPTYSWDVMVVTHELGHNFGSSHTHACVWNGDDTQIDDCGNGAGGGDGVFDDNDDGVEDDGCFNPFAMPAQARIIPAGGGTIMSYCHLESVGINLSAGFGPQPGDLIRSRVAGAGCLSSECSCQVFTDREVSGAPIPSAVYVASNSITSPGVATGAAPQVVVFRAGQFIELRPGFEATELFIAEVVDGLCDESGGSSALLAAPPASSPAASADLRAAQALNLYPNPASERVHLAYYLPASGLVSLHILNPYGQVVEAISLDDYHEQGEHLRELPILGWPPGLYYAVLRTGTGQEVRGFVVGR